MKIHTHNPLNFVSYLQWLEIELQDLRNIVLIQKAAPKNTAPNNLKGGSGFTNPLPNGGNI